MFPDLLRGCSPGLSRGQIETLESHYRLLVRWNRSLNLTTVVDLPLAVERHYCESLFVGRFLAASPHSIVDIGSGPGFPGFPLAVLRPDCAVTLIESHKRKAVFLKEAGRSVPNLRVLGMRAEEVHDSFDVAVSRAVSYQDLVGNLSRLAPKCAVLAGVEIPPPELGFVWDAPIPLPWGNQRFLRCGTRLRTSSEIDSAGT